MGFDPAELFESYFNPLDICHFSGEPEDSLVDTSTDLSEPVNPFLKKMLRKIKMKRVCLEMPWHKMDFEQAKAVINRFREKYSDLPGL